MKKFREREKYGHGGDIDDKKAMILSQIKEVHHHADELEKVLANMDTVDAWVVGKMERATTDLSDITHYLDGTTEYARGGEVRYNIKGNNFSDKIENGKKFKDLIIKVFQNQSGEQTYPQNFIQETAFTGKIVKHDGSNYLKDYSYRGTITKFSFLDDKDFIQALKYVDRPAIRKLEDGGELTENAEIEIVKNEDGVFKVYYTKGDIGFDGRMRKYHSGRDYEYEFEPDYFDDEKSEEYFYNDGDGVIEKEILDAFYSKKTTEYAKGGKIVGDIGKSGTQYGYTLKEWEEKAEKVGLLVSPKEWWKNQQGKKYKDSFGRTKTIGQFSQDERIEMEYYGYLIAIGMDLGSKKIPKSAIKYVEDNNYKKMARGGETSKKEMLWQSIKDKFSEVFYADTDDEKNEIFSNDVKAEEHIWMFDRYSPYPSTLSWADAKSLFLRKLTKEEKDIITIEYDVRNISEAFGLMWEKKILVKLNTSGRESGMMARGGKVKYDYIPKYEIESINTWDGENIEEKDILDGAYVKKSRKR